jgi:integrase
MSRHQEGYIWRVGRSWYGRWREDVVSDGTIQDYKKRLIPKGRIARVQHSEKLAEYSDRYRRDADVRPLLAEKLRPLNERKQSPESTLTLAQYVKDFFLPRAEQECKPSTVAGYKARWNAYLSEQREMQIRLRDFRCVSATNLFAEIHRKHNLGRTTLKHIKSLLSAVFTYAKQQGVLDGMNPIKDSAIPRAANAPEETYATSADEVLGILDVLERAKEFQTRAAVALVFFAGLRPGEARGAKWEDYDGQTLTVRHSVWHTHETDPKTAASAKPVPIIDPLRTILAELRKAEGYPARGPILRGPSGKPLNLDNVAKRRLMPALRNPENYPQPYKAELLAWHGWYSLRRGIATLTSSISRDPMAAKGLLRHSSVNTTLAHYIKDVPEVTRRAMEQVEALIAPHAFKGRAN